MTFKCDLIAALHAASLVQVDSTEVVDWELETMDDDPAVRCLKLDMANEDMDPVYIALDAGDKLEVEIMPCGRMSYAKVIDYFDSDERFIYFGMMTAFGLADLAAHKSACNGEAPLITLPVTTKHPTDYVLVNQRDGTMWRGTPEGHWVAERNKTTIQYEPDGYQSSDGIASEAPVINNLTKVR